MAAYVAMFVAACGQAAAPTVLRGEPSAYLLTIDQMASPDFTLSTPPHSLTAADVPGFLAGAGEEFFRAAGSLAEANGPLQVRDSVEEFASPLGAATAYGADVARLDADAAAKAASTGALGDAAHATTRTATASDGTVVLELTVEWRVDNLVDVLVVRGRNGGTRLDDALLLAHRQTVTELGLATPRPRSASPGATP
ncbi:MAG: hypothetical protein M3019_04835 [Candidatus Dormibacteraeota bacterium]|nr:hypothetical protein [Candidatus Dormibacteraeota bacterium]